MKRVGLSAENASHAELLRMRLISASQEDGVNPNSEIASKYEEMRCIVAPLIEAAEKNSLPAQPSLGVNQYSGCDNVTPSDRGNTETYALRRLRRDNPELAERVLNNEISANAAAIEAGFRDKTVTVPVDYAKAARVLLKHFDRDELYEAMGREQ